VILVAAGLFLIVAGIGTMVGLALFTEVNPSFRVVAPFAVVAVVGGLVLSLGLKGLHHDRLDERERAAQVCVDDGGVPWLHGRRVDCLR
jgi:hypothetical protein